MHTTSLRLRLAPTFEWLVAAAFLAATLAVGMLLVRELRSTPSPAPIQVPTEPTAGGPAAVPDRAVPVSSLLLTDGAQVRVGDTLAQVERVVGASAQAGEPVVETGPLGARSIRTYERQGTRFLLVFEPFERNGPPRVSGIYLQ
jgi:hypothetical protein